MLLPATLHSANSSQLIKPLTPVRFDSAQNISIARPGRDRADGIVLHYNDVDRTYILVMEDLVISFTYNRPIEPGAVVYINEKGEVGFSPSHGKQVGMILSTSNTESNMQVMMSGLNLDIKVDPNMNGGFPPTSNFPPVYHDPNPFIGNTVPVSEPKKPMVPDSVFEAWEDDLL